MHFQQSYSQWSLQRSHTLFHKSHLAWGAFLPQTKAVPALATSDSGVFWWDPTFTPCHSLHLPLLLLVCEGTFPFLTLCCCKDRQENCAELQLLSAKAVIAALMHWKTHRSKSLQCAYRTSSLSQSIPTFFNSSLKDRTNTGRGTQQALHWGFPNKPLNFFMTAIYSTCKMKCWKMTDWYSTKIKYHTWCFNEINWFTTCNVCGLCVFLIQDL